MSGWSDGYFMETQYVSNAYPELAPAYLAFACLRQSVRPPELGPGASYLELGCGQGYGLNVLAAANPEMTFRGVDFHPGQIANAQRLARTGRLSNVTSDDQSFEQLLAAPEGALPKFDIVALHGIYSWISPENRAVVVRILDRVVKPGGLVYVSYNALPGWASLAPLQRFVREFVARSPGDPRTQVVAAFRQALHLAEHDAEYFATAPHLKAYIEQALKRDPAYLAHEYLNAESQPLFHADVARELDAARLSFAASATGVEDLVHLAIPQPLQAMVRDAGDPVWRETLGDYASNKRFRRDIFVRGRNTLSEPERSALLDGMRFALLTPKDDIRFEFEIPLGRMRGAQSVYGPIVAALAEGPKTGAELRAGVDLATVQPQALLQALTLLISRRHVHPAKAADAAPPSATAFNRAVLDRLPLGDALHYLACPAAGAGVRLEFEELLSARAALRGEDDADQVARSGWEIMSRANRRLVKDGQVLQDEASNLAELRARLARFSAVKLPLLRALGAL